MVNAFVSNLPDNNAIIQVSAVTIGISFMGILSGVAWGLNAGFNVIIMKCVGLGQYKIFKRYIKRQVRIILVYIVFFIICVAL